MFFRWLDGPQSGLDWWASARLYRGERPERLLEAAGSLAEMVTQANEAAPAVQADLTIDLTASGYTLSPAEWRLLADRPDIPVFM